MNAVTETTMAEADASVAETPRSLDRFRARRAELKEIGQSVAKQAGSKVEDFFQANRKSIEAVLPRYLTTDRLLRIAQGAIRQTPRLQECTIGSLFGAVLICAQMGLEPNTHQGHCWLIPRKNSRPKKGPDGRVMEDNNRKWIWEDLWEVQVQLGYKGRIELAYRSPKIKLLKAVPAYENDPVLDIDEGTVQTIQHKPLLRGNRGEIIGFYAVAKLDTGEALFEWMPVEDVNRIRDEYSDAYAGADEKRGAARHALEQARGDKERAKATKELAKAEDSPWIRDYVEMGRKTLINRISKYMPSTPEMALAAALDDRDLLGKSQELDGVLDGTFTVTETGESQSAQEDGEQGTASGDQVTDTKKADSKPAPQLTHEKSVTMDDIMGTKKEAEKVLVGEVESEDPAAGMRQADPERTEKKPEETKQPDPEPERKPGPPTRRRGTAASGQLPLDSSGGFGSVE